MGTAILKAKITLSNQVDHEFLRSENDGDQKGVPGKIALKGPLSSVGSQPVHGVINIKAQTQKSPAGFNRRGFLWATPGEPGATTSF